MDNKEGGITESDVVREQRWLLPELGLRGEGPSIGFDRDNRGALWMELCRTTHYCLNRTACHQGAGPCGFHLEPATVDAN